jgi:hypothetical protein
MPNVDLLARASLAAIPEPVPRCHRFSYALQCKAEPFTNHGRGRSSGTRSALRPAPPRCCRSSSWPRQQISPRRASRQPRRCRWPRPRWRGGTRPVYARRPFGCRRAEERVVEFTSPRCADPHPLIIQNGVSLSLSAVSVSGSKPTAAIWICSCCFSAKPRVATCLGPASDQ